MEIEQLEIYSEIINRRIAETLPEGVVWQFSMTSKDEKGTVAIISNLQNPNDLVRFLAGTIVAFTQLKK